MKQRIGLGKKVSSIFDGVAVPGSQSGVGTSSVGSGTSSPGMSIPKQADRAPQSGPSRPPQRAAHDFVLPQQKVSPTRQRVALAAMLLLAVVFAVLVWQLFLNKPSPSAPKPMAVSADPAIVAQPTAIKSHDSVIAYVRPGPWPADLRNPFRAPPLPSSPIMPESNGPVILPPPSLTITGIVVDKHDSKASMAMVNDREVHNGDKIGGVNGVTVLKINEHSIDFECNGTKFTQTYR
jgi:hypothetical protein